MTNQVVELPTGGERSSEPLEEGKIALGSHGHKGGNIWPVKD